MAWVYPPTFVAGGWTVAQAQQNISDNLASSRHAQISPATWDQTVVVNNVAGTVITHSPIATAIAGEATKMVVFLSYFVSIFGTGTPTTLTISIKDQAGTVISNPSPAVAINVVESTTYALTGTVTIAAGVTPGFTVYAFFNTGSRTVYFTSTALLVPL